MNGRYISVEVYDSTNYFQEDAQMLVVKYPNLFTCIEDVEEACTIAYCNGYSALDLGYELFEFQAFIYPYSGMMTLTTKDDRPVQVLTENNGYPLQ